MKKKDLKIALALSGGGVRAAVFHLGVLARLAKDDLIEQVTYLSTVSGGSLVTGLIYSIAGLKWPTSTVFRDECLPRAHYYLTRTNLQTNYILRFITRIYLLFVGRASVLSDSLHGRWKIAGTLQDLQTPPRWMINATSFESGKNWRFEKRKMGDYVLNYVADPKVDLTDALAASAGFPGLIGSLKLKTKDHTWFRYVKHEGRKATREPFTPEIQRIHLWDGGVYDNLGLEAIYKEGKEYKYRKEFNFIIASDAGGDIEVKEGSFIERVIGIIMSQVQGLRARSLVSYFNKHKNSGVYLKMGNAAAYLLEQAPQSSSLKDKWIKEALPAIKAKEAEDFKTRLRKMTNEEFFLIFRHGWEVADLTLIAHCPDLFQHVGYRKPRM